MRWTPAADVALLREVANLQVQTLNHHEQKLAWNQILIALHEGDKEVFGNLESGGACKKIFEKLYTHKNRIYTQQPMPEVIHSWSKLLRLKAVHCFCFFCCRGVLHKQPTKTACAKELLLVQCCMCSNILHMQQLTHTYTIGWHRQPG